MQSLQTIRPLINRLSVGDMRESVDLGELQETDLVRGVALLLTGWAIIVIAAGDVNPVIAFFTAPLSNLIVTAAALPIVLILVARLSQQGHRLALARRTLVGIARVLGRTLLPLALIAAALIGVLLAFQEIITPLSHDGFLGVLAALVLGLAGLVAGLALLVAGATAYIVALVLIEVRTAGAGAEHRPVGRLVEFAEALVALTLITATVVAGQAGTAVLLGGAGAITVGALAVRELIQTGLRYDATSRDLRAPTKNSSSATQSRMSEDWTPTPEELAAAIDAGRAQDDADAYAASGEGDGVYEAVLQHLVGLVGSEIEVQVGVATGTSPLATLSGTLWAAADIEWSGDEVLFFAVGDVVNGFYLGREQFVCADAHASHSEDGTLELVDADGATLRIRDKTFDHE